ncbi:MAG: NUDIX domain-containing protein [Spirochaetota bacterium]
MSYSIRVRATGIVIENDSILLIKYDDDNGIHYNLPGGGVQEGESIIQALKRELKEEADIDIDAGSLVFTTEYIGKIHNLALFFECKLKEGSYPRMPETRDDFQIDVEWVHHSKLKDIKIYPEFISNDLFIKYMQDKKWNNDLFIIYHY